MSDPQQIDKDLKDYLSQEHNMRREDRLIYLRAIFDKHFTLRQLDHMITAPDLLEIISTSKGGYSTQKVPMFISKRRMDHNEITHIAVLEAFISYLNRMNLLKKLVNFDYKE